MIRARRLLTAAADPALLFAVPAFSSPPVQRPTKQYTIEQFMETVSIRGAAFTADEKQLLFSSNKTGIFNVNAVPVAGGAAAPLTDSAVDSTFIVSAFPFDARFLYTHDQGGNENNHLYVKAPGGKEQDLTPGEKLKAIFAGWTHDGAGFYVRTNERDERYFDLYLHDAKTYARTARVPGRSGLRPRRDLGRRQVARVSEGQLDRRQRHVPLELRDEGNEAPFEARRRRHVRTRGLRPRLALALLPDQRRRGVHARAAMGARDRQDRRRREVRLGRRVDLLLLGRQVPRFGSEPGRAHGAQGLRRQDRGGSRAAGISLRRDLFGARFAQRDEARLRARRRPRSEQPLRVRVRSEGADAADGHHVEGRRPGRPRRGRSRALSLLRRDADPEHLLQALPGDAAREGARARLGARRAGRPDAPTVQCSDPVPRQPWLRDPGDQQPRQLRLRQVLQHGRRPQTRARTAVGLRRGQEVPAEPRVRRRRPHRNHRRQLRRIHGPRGPRLPARTVRRGRRHFRGRQLDPDPRVDPEVLGVPAPGALQGDRGPREGPRIPEGDLAALPRGQDPQAAHRRPGRQRPARHQARVRRHRRGREEERRAGRIRGLPRRGARVLEEEEPDRGVERDPRRSWTGI